MFNNYNFYNQFNIKFEIQKDKKQIIWLTHVYKINMLNATH